MVFKKSVVGVFWVLCLIFSNVITYAGEKDLEQTEWVESKLASMTLEEKIGQLFMVATYSNKSVEHTKEIEDLIQNEKIGGLIFFQGGPVRQAQLTNHYQKLSKSPLLIGIDGEWGLSMRLDSIAPWPYQMTLGAVENDSLIYEMAKDIGRQMKLLGIHLNFAPVVDINSNPNNPVIGKRSFGENKYLLSQKSIAYMKGLQDQYLLACAKHFPGHGDTDSDSHYSLPLVNKSVRSLENQELYPFEQLIKNGIRSVMVGHLAVPALNNQSQEPASLSKNIIGGLLQDKMGFQGLVISDALNMKGVTKGKKAGEVELEAFMAGNDILLFPRDVSLGIKKIKKSIKKGKVSEEQLDTKVRKILYAKYWAGLASRKSIDIAKLEEKLYTPSTTIIREKLYNEAITLVKNTKELLPVHILDTMNFASVAFNTKGKGENTFQEILTKYTAFDHYSVSRSGSNQYNYSALQSKLERYKTVVVGLHGMKSSSKKNYGLNQKQIDVINSLRKKGINVITVVFGSPYSLKNFSDHENLILAYEDNDLTQRAAAQIIFGALPAKGSLPVSSGNLFRVGEGIKTKALHRLGFMSPESVGIDGNVLMKIDSIANKAIELKATPGCRVLLARKGKIVFDKAYGTKGYKGELISKESIYDVASVTKVAGTLQLAMFLESRGLLDVNQKASFYLPELKGSNKENMRIVDMLTHQAGLYPYIPFWKETIEDSVKHKFYKTSRTEVYNIPVSKNLYAHKNLPDSIWKWVIGSKLREPKKTKKSSWIKRRFYKEDKPNFAYDYKYSDQGFYILKKIVERLTNQNLDDFLAQNFYKPMGLNSTSFLAWKHLRPELIVPTEKDNYFRNNEIKGYVHDPISAMNGGVEGHAGLFSDAYGLAKLLQMCLQDGYYGGIRYFKKGTIDKFAFAPFVESNENRRGIGWDKPVKDGEGPSSSWASKNSYGHLGFTGTAVWADPDYDLVYVFLSNRTYPSSTNNLLIQESIRTKIHDTVYESLYEFIGDFPKLKLELK